MPTVTKTVKVREKTPTKKFIQDFIDTGLPGIEIFAHDSYDYRRAPHSQSIKKALKEMDVPVKLIERTFGEEDKPRRFLINVDVVRKEDEEREKIKSESSTHETVVCEHCGHTHEHLR